MNREDVVRMAREAGIRMAGPMDTVDARNVYAHELERFAALVAAAERDRVARIIEAQDVDPAFKHRLASAIKEPPR